MADKNQNRNRGNQDTRQDQRNQSIGNQQGTTQTGGQSSGGTDRRTQDDSFTEDLRQSGQRSSRKETGGREGR